MPSVQLPDVICLAISPRWELLAWEHRRVGTTGSGLGSRDDAGTHIAERGEGILEQPKLGAQKMREDV